MFVEVLLCFLLTFGLFEENELCFEVAVMLVVDDWSLDGEVDVVHEGTSVGAEIAVGVALGKFFTCFFDSFLFLLRLFLFSLLDYSEVGLGQTR